ncbi:4-hydroxyproline 2-epimerase [Moraxellaceae bacterium 17A]|nr:4-hydroxyproline 2-epimerase [Moraxellaceae bacterium 17A]
MSKKNLPIKIIDSHTGGEPTRMVYAGFPELTGQTVADKMQDFRSNYDHLRRGIILEPRGNDVMVGALLCQPSNDKAVTGVIFFNNTGYLGMCGHGTIGVIISLAYQGKIQVGEHWIETPVGMVKAVLDEDHKVSVINVPSYRYQTNIPLTVPDLGLIHGDIAWGGNWFFLVEDHNQKIEHTNVKHLTNVCTNIKKSLQVNGITGKDGQEIDHIELFAPSLSGANSKSFVLCPGEAYDRSPCGTGTSAKIACLAADNKLAPGDTWQQESVIGSVFEASYSVDDNSDIIPTIRGTAAVCSESTLIFNENDPFCYGIAVI